MKTETHDANGNEFSDVRARREYDEARHALVLAAQDNQPLSVDMAQRLNALLKNLDSTMDVHTMSKGYDTLVGNDGEVLVLTAGDHHFEPSGLKLN